MEKEQVYIEKRFDDFSQCTDYYYEELGKLSQVPELTKREEKRVKKVIMNSMFASFKVLKKEEKQLNEMAETMDKELYNDFKSSREDKPGFLSKIKQIFKKDKKIEVLEHNEVKALEQNISSQASDEIVSCEENVSKTNSDISEDFKKAKSDDAKGKEPGSASHDDEPLNFWYWVSSIHSGKYTTWKILK